MQPCSPISPSNCEDYSDMVYLYDGLMLLSESMDLLICESMEISSLPVICSASVAFHTENWHRVPRQAEKFTWLVVSFCLITLTITSFTGEKLTPSPCVYYRALTMLRHASWCRHPANSFINDLRVWYSRRKKNRKTCSCPSEFLWHGALYRADRTSERGEREFRLVLNSTVVPSGYSRGHTSPTVTLTWCCNIYHSPSVHCVKYTFSSICLRCQACGI